MTISVKGIFSVLTTAGAVMMILYLNQSHLWKPTTRPRVKNEALKSIYYSQDKGLACLGCKKPPMFVAILEYQGQQGNGLASLRHFRCILPNIYKDSYILEPQIRDSHMKTFLQNSLYFSSFFNLEYFNAQSRQVGYSDVIREEIFVEASAKHVIFIIIARHSSVQRLIWEADDNDTSSCLGSKEIQPLLHIRSLKRHHKTLLNGALMKHKCIVRVIELTGLNVHEFKVVWSESIKHQQDLYNFIFDKWSPHEVTLVVDYWSMTIHVPGTRCNCTNFHRLLPSTELISKARKYEEKFLGGGNNLAIMLRVEKLVQLARDRKFNHTMENYYIKECFQETFSIQREVTGNSTGIIPFVTLDVGGQYGTDSFKKLSDDAIVMARNMFTSLYNGSWTMSEWEQSFVQVADGVTDRGYIAALQRVLASRADCLIMTGGGRFQKLAHDDYMYHHRNSSSKCSFRLCDKNYPKAELNRCIPGDGWINYNIMHKTVGEEFK